MDNVTFISLPNSDGVEVEHAIIDKGEGNFVSMLKSTYEAQQASLNDTPQG
jgi:hypothetical protein